MKMLVPTAFALLLLLSFNTCNVAGAGANFIDTFEVFWGNLGSEAKISTDGQQAQLSLDQNSGSAFESRGSYLFGSISMQIKLVPGDSAGTVTSFYMASAIPNSRDEMDFEFLGNVSGEPILLQTNVYANGIGGREQRIKLWFDPTADFHTYSVLWNHHQIVFLVDGLPIRRFLNNEAHGVAFPNKQPMRVFSSIWDGDNWATQGGRVKIDWNHAPFTASFRNFQPDACANTVQVCTAIGRNDWWNAPRYQNLDAKQNSFLHYVRRTLMVYDYCLDKARYPQAPPDCVYQ